VVSKYGDIVFGFQSSKQKFSAFGLTYNWVKKSIFRERLYWETNLFRHNFDVIHIEKMYIQKMKGIVPLLSDTVHFSRR
jgi:hypothetical protein